MVALIIWTPIIVNGKVRSLPVNKHTSVFIDKELDNFPLIKEKSNTYQLFSHGRSGELLIDGEWKNAAQVANFLKSKIANLQSQIVNLNIYGCEFAKGEKGLAAVKYLEKALGVSVAASTNITGKGGDWILEVGQPRGNIELPNYDGSLQTSITIQNPGQQMASTSQSMSGNAATDLVPTGGTSPYTYSNGSGDAACVAPSGATALPSGSNFTVNSSTGAYTYTAPSTAGTYYFCVKVCDNTTPTPNCKVAVYTVVAVAPINLTNICPSTTVNLMTAVSATNMPSGTILTWHNAIPISNANKVADSTKVGAGTYYAAFYDTVNKCYSLQSAAVTVTIITCPLAVTENGTVAATGGTAIPNVLTNDTVNGVPATTTNSTISQSGTWPTGISLNPTTGAVTVAAGTAPGSYPVTYQLCDKLTPQNCATVTDTVKVTPVIAPVTENGTVTSTGGTAIPNVLSNDTINGVPATTTNSTISQSGTWPTGISLNPATGAVTVAAGTAPGSYPVTYQLCDKLTPQNCATVTDTVKVTPVIAPVTENGTVTATGGTAIPNVLTNDTVNGVPATTTNSTISQSGTWPTGISLNPATGAVTVAAGTAPGSYPVTYQLCDKLTPQTCATVIDTVKVTPVIAPVTENGTVAATGGTAIPNVLTNDTVNGVPATTTNSTISQSGTWPTGISLNPATGAVTVAAGTAPGSYPVTYQLCDKLTPQTCATVTDTVKVTPVIVPVTENGTVAATGGTAIPNVLTNDTVNGVPATTTNSTISQSGTWPTGISLNPATGAVTVAAGTAPGSYPVTYQLCDKLTPQTCATVIDTVKVTPVIAPVTENGTVATTGGTAIPNVLTNDTINGVPATTTNSTISQSGTWPTGISLDPTTGAVTVAAGTAPGSYPVTYQLCDKLTPQNCATVTDTVKVTPVIDPVTENGTVATTGGTAIPNVLTNDTINGVPATTTNSTISQSGTWPTGISLNPTTGAVTVAAGTAPGSYPVTYQLCDKLTPQTCATVTDTVKVTPVIAPVTENGTVAATGGTAIPNVLSNDTINGVPATTTNATISQSGTWPTGISLNPTTGAVTVAAGTAPGSYPVTYQLCDKLTPQTCATVIDTVKVTPVIAPVTENGTVAATGGTAIPNVLSNDTINGVPATTTNATISQSGTWPTGISLNPTTGAVTVAAGTAPGSYPVTYQLCDKLTPQTCATVTDTVKVTPVIAPVTENGTVTSTGGTAIPNVLSNDTINGVPATTTNSTISQSGTWPTGISLNPATGAVTVAAGTAPGSYPVTYQLCDKLTPQTCETVTDTVKVTPVIAPVTENGTVAATGGTAIPNVLTNDTVNGVPATTTNSTISQSGTWPTGISLDPTTGAVTVAAGTAPGSYPVTYQLCDKLTPQNCATVTDTVKVTPVIAPVTENGTVATTGGTAIPNVLTNDTVNGVPATTTNSTISQSGTWPTGISLNPATGAVTVAAGTAPGSYPVAYQLCDKLTPQTCATVTDTVKVTPVIAPVTENGTVTSTGGTAIPNVLSNDTINGVPATTTNSTISQSGTWPTGISLNPATGAVTVAAGTAPGSYPVTYQLCDKLTPQTCETVTDTVKVTPVIAPVTENGTVAATGGTAIPNVLTNDTVNGVPATTTNSTISQSGTWPTGISLDPTTGAVTVAAGTAPGSYPVTYQLCDKLTPQNCATVTDTVKVTPVIAPVTENGTVATTGGTAIPNVLTNDTVNGVPATTTNSTISQSGTWPTGISLDPTTGAVTVAAGTAPGSYPVTYQLCDKLTPQTCATVTDTVKVTPVIAPVTENGTVATTGGTAIPNVLSNDTVNGVPATTTNSTISQSGTWPTGISLDPTTGAVTVAAGTTPGSYPVTYQLCDKLTPQNCATVIDTVKVTPVIAPVTENGTVATTGGTAIPNVLSNDTVNGVPATTTNSTISQSGTWPTGISLNPATGAVTVAAGTAPGSYPVTYQLCDKLTPQTCATVIDTVKVTPVIAPVTENGTVAATGGTAIPNVLTNDTVNGVPATTTNSTISQSGTWPTGISLNPATGAVTVAAGTAPGSYPVTYQLCDKLTPQTCATVTDTVKVTPVIVPVTENGTVAATGGTAIPNVLTNDTVNGVPATTTNSTISQSGTWPTGISLNPATGAVTVAAGTAPGSYPVTYQLCDKLTPQTCATVIDTVKVTPVIAPVTENGTVAATGGTAIPNVLTNDTINGVPATTTNSTISQSGTWPTGISLNPTTGAVTVAAGTAPGSYPVTYQLCDKLTPQTCKTVTDTVKVTAIPCVAGTLAPAITATTAANVCPAVTVNLGSLVNTGTKPAGTTLVWSTHKVPTSGTDTLSSLLVSTSGTYYALYYDANGKCFSPADSVVITITNCNLPPVIVATAIVTTENKPVTQCMTVTDPNSGDVLTPTLCTPAAAHGTVTNVTLVNGQLCMTYTPTAGYSGTDQICVKVCDQSGACDQVLVPVTVSPLIPPTVTPVAPVITPESITTPKNTPITVCTPVSDANAGDVLTPSLCTPSALNGTVSGLSLANGQVCLTYTPNTGYTGQDAICLSVCDQTSLCTQTTIPVTVTATPDPTVPEPPIVVIAPIVTPTGVAITVCGSINDPNGDHGTTSSVCTNPTAAHGTVTAVSSTATQVCFTYTPAPGYAGPDAICIQVCDTTGLCTQTKVPVLVEAIPCVAGTLAPAITATMAANVCPAVTVNLGSLVNTGTKPAGTTLVWSTHKVPTSGTDTLSSLVVSTAGTYYALYYDANGKCFSPADSVTVMFSICNLPPVIVATPIVTTEGKPVTQCMTVTDPNAGDVLTPTLCTPAAAHGTVTNVTLVNGQLCMTYTPTAGYSGTDQICVKVCDQLGACDQVFVPVIVSKVSPPEVTPVAPVIIPASITTPKNTPITVCTSVSDANAGDVLTPSLCTPSAVNGVVSNLTLINGQICLTYTPNTGFTGQDAICLSVCDQTGLCTQTTIPVTVTATPDPTVPEPPIVVIAPIVTPSGVVVTVCGSINDPNGDHGTTSSVCTNPTAAHGTVTAVSSSATQVCFTYTPAPGYAGQDAICIQVCDTTGLCTQTKVPILVTPASNIAVLNLKVLLQGALLPTSSSGGPIMTGIMRDDLRTAGGTGVIPSKEPYTALANPRFTNVGGGGETLGAGVLTVTGNDAIVDWVFVELRDAANPATILKTKSALVQRDGDVVESLDGISPLTFTGMAGQSYYVSVKHRNHLGAMTATAIPLTITGTIVDFTTMTAAQTYNTAAQYDGFEQVDVNGKMALWAGNTNADTKVKYVGVANDQIPVFSQAVGYVNNTTQQYNYDFVTPVYLSGDVNMDGKVKYRGTNNDPAFIFYNVITRYALLNTASLYNYDLFLEQLP